jgi:hypothetical protein
MIQNTSWEVDSCSAGKDNTVFKKPSIETCREPPYSLAPRLRHPSDLEGRIALDTVEWAVLGESFPRDRNTGWTFQRIHIPLTQFFRFTGAVGMEAPPDRLRSDVWEIGCDSDFHTPSRRKKSCSGTIYHCDKLFCKVWAPAAAVIISLQLHKVGASDRLHKKLIYPIEKQFAFCSSS